MRDLRAANPREYWYPLASFGGMTVGAAMPWPGKSASERLPSPIPRPIVMVGAPPCRPCTCSASVSSTATSPNASAIAAASASDPVRPLLPLDPDPALVGRSSADLLRVLECISSGSCEPVRRENEAAGGSGVGRTRAIS
ncbi:hypothetical protein OF846_001974 [Rhodotorula toruloides]|nr:hypothetical protein OF846_001974 [Rhodotorula toruloides]